MAAAGDARPLLADLNAVSPDTMTALHERATAAGFALVDGVRTRVVGDRVGSASGVKMCTASVHKGTTAVWAQALQTAHRLGVLDVVLDDLSEAHPEEVAAAARRVTVATSRAHRFVGEMEQIAATQGAAGASAELYTGKAAVYRRLAATDLASLSPEEAADLADLTDVLRRLT